MISTITLVISMIALAVCMLAALNCILKYGLKGLKEKGKLLGITFFIYVVTFLIFLITQ